MTDIPVTGCDAWRIDTSRAEGAAVISAHTHECVHLELDHDGDHVCRCGHRWQDRVWS